MANEKYVTNLRYPGNNSDLRFEMTIDMGAWAEAWKKFSCESGKRAAKMINDQAFKFRHEVYKTIRDRYIVRSNRFINSAVIIGDTGKDNNDIDHRLYTSGNMIALHPHSHIRRPGQEGCYFSKKRTANTRVEKMKHPRAKLRSVFLEKVMTYLTSSPLPGWR
jgi:hypothetical protein